MATDKEKARARARRYAAKKRAALAARGQTETDAARAAGGLKAYRARKAKEARERRRKTWKAGRPQRGPGSGAPIVAIGALARADDAAGYPDFPKLVREWAPRFLARYRHRYTGRQAMFVFEAARKSLPPHPTELEFRAWLLALRSGEGGKVYAAGTLNRFRETLFSLYEFARVRGGPWHNPIADVEPLQDDAVKAVPLNEKNVRTYYARAMTLLDDPRDRGLVATLRFTGLRISEVLGLRADDIEWQADGGARLHVTRQRDEGGFSAGPLKHIRQRRFIRIHPELEQRLREVLSLGPPLVKMGKGHRGKNAAGVAVPFLFPHRVKGMRKLARKLKALLPEGEWPAGQAFHAFRHSFSLEAWRRARMPLDEISKWLGHSSLAVTEKYLRDLAGYDSPATALERLWAAQAGEPMPVESLNAQSTQAYPLRVVQAAVKPSKSEKGEQR